jgi:hypothetical protein
MNGSGSSNLPLHHSVIFMKGKTAHRVNNISQYFFAHEGLCNFSLSLYIGR